MKVVQVLPSIVYNVDIFTALSARNPPIKYTTPVTLFLKLHRLLSCVSVAIVVSKVLQRGNKFLFKILCKSKSSDFLSFCG